VAFRQLLQPEHPGWEPTGQIRDAGDGDRDIRDSPGRGACGWHGDLCQGKLEEWGGCCDAGRGLLGLGDLWRAQGACQLGATKLGCAVPAAPWAGWHQAPGVSGTQPDGPGLGHAPWEPLLPAQGPCSPSTPGRHLERTRVQLGMVERAAGERHSMRRRLRTCSRHPDNEFWGAEPADGFPGHVLQLVPPAPQGAPGMCLPPGPWQPADFLLPTPTHPRREVEAFQGALLRRQHPLGGTDGPPPPRSLAGR